ncbi:DUF885 domain-containing protein [Nocardioides panacisoli]|uniref:DUF885 domain-containing protein n=1 Tax=Nocardioides panacisoli TaxID=627624 RepID=UPI001C633942|nr:DUF885 domain-containing protein [Nocardioides panacisoli]QYJ04371.1 DUF885 domain-containing protein [Nocardioides panacisoli]
MTRSIDQRSDRHVTEMAALDPLSATFAGIPGHDHELPDLSPDGHAAREQLQRDALADVSALTPTDDREAVARDAFRERVGLEVEMVDAGVVRSEVSVIGSAAHGLRECFDLMATETDEDWDAVEARLAGIPRALEDYRTTLREEAAAGHVVARRQYLEVAEQVKGWTGETGSAGDFFGAFVAHAPEQRRTRLQERAAAASAAFADFGRFLVADLAPQGRETDAVGRDHYALASRYFLGAAVDLEETYRWGWEELARLVAEQRRTAEEIKPGASIAEAVQHLDDDPANWLGVDAFRDWMQQTSDRTLAELARTHFDVPDEIRTLECCIAPTNDGGVYYTGPTEDFSRPGQMWFSFAEGFDARTPWRELTTVFHEGVPGHHLQVGQAVAQADTLNRWQRLMCWVSGHGEGWALYAERLMDELGWFADPADRMGFLDMQAFRAARVIVDIGLHLQLRVPDPNPFGFHPGETWTPDLVAAFMRQHSSMDDGQLAFEVNRYLGWPGQAPSYKVGERIWLEARADAERRHGADFDLRAFHRSALDLGALGLDPLRDALARL